MRGPTDRVPGAAVARADIQRDAISLVVLCDDQAELDRYWNALLEGGGKAQACGWLIDRFGVRWQILPAALEKMMRDKDPAAPVPRAILRLCEKRR